MHHAAARVAIQRILAGGGFGERALAVVQAADLHDRADAPQPLRELAVERAAALPMDPASPWNGPELQLPVPGDERTLAIQLAPAIAQRGRDAALGLACLDALARLWPHVGSDERPLLRTRFLNGLAARTAPDGSWIDLATLRAWQRNLPTSYGSSSPSVASLRGLLTEGSAEGAYRVLAEHLSFQVDFPTLSWVLGTLAMKVLAGFRDTQGQVLRVLSGTSASERLATLLPPEHHATLMSQLAHQLWWSRAQSGLHSVRICLDDATCSLDEAVASGDLTLAQRAARTAAREPRRFWSAVWRLVQAQIAADAASTPLALGIAAAVVWRAGADAIPPDDAAAMGTMLADLAWRERRMTVGIV